jgi:hypothetical protein
MKALAPDAVRRYRSAHDFQADLQAFLENKPARAELERRYGWKAGATVQRIRKLTRTVVQFHRHIRVVSGVSWFLLGMALWIGGTLTWRWVHEPWLTLRLPAMVRGVSRPAPAPFYWCTAPPGPATLDKVPGFEPDPPPAPAPPHRKARPRRYRLWR